VTLTPDDIEVQQFPIVFRGYKVADVDAFLDRLQKELAEMLADRAGDLSAAGSVDQWQPDQTPTPDSGALSATGADELTRSEAGPATVRALRTLQRAEQTAEQVIVDAAVEADGIRSQAEKEARTIVAAARAESDRIEADTTQRRQREVGALLAQAQQIRAEIDRLTALERQYRDALQGLLSEQQRLLEERLPGLDAASEAALTTTDGHRLAA
jgi:DivIVA domain-containing protein